VDRDPGIDHRRRRGCTNTYPVPGLVWANGTPSGYTVGPLPAAGEVMAFDVDIAP